MHEASLAFSVLAIVEEECRRSGHSRVNSVRIRVGRASGVLPEALELAFDAGKRGTRAAEARLFIEEVELAGRCRSCGGRSTAKGSFLFECGHCGGTRLEIISGYELQVLDMEVD